MYSLWDLIIFTKSLLFCVFVKSTVFLLELSVHPFAPLKNILIAQIVFKKSSKQSKNLRRKFWKLAICGNLLIQRWSWTCKQASPRKARARGFALSARRPSAMRAALSALERELNQAVRTTDHSCLRQANVNAAKKSLSATNWTDLLFLNFKKKKELQVFRTLTRWAWSDRHMKLKKCENAKSRRTENLRNELGTDLKQSKFQKKDFF